MSRLISVALTEPQVVARTKTVTRRLGWWTDKNGRRLLHAGDELTLCRKVMGRRNGEPLVRLAQVRVVSVTREPLGAMQDTDVQREGFPEWSVDEFVEFFCRSMKTYPEVMVTRIEWEYLPDAQRETRPSEDTHD